VTKLEARDRRETRVDIIGELARRIQAEYAEMPGLCVTLPQAQRLWAVDRRTCEAAISRLVEHGMLTMTTKGRFIRMR
jgi:hypothetical protein